MTAGQANDIINLLWAVIFVLVSILIAIYITAGGRRS